MVEKNITPKEFEQLLQPFVGQELSSVFYITDNIVVFQAGEKYLRDKNDTKSRFDYEYELTIDGGWEYEKDGITIETSIPKSGQQDLSKLRARIGTWIESLHPQKVTFIKVSKDGKTSEIGLDTGGKFIVHAHNDLFVSYSHRSFGANGEFVSATHVRPNENTGELTLVTAP